MIINNQINLKMDELYKEQSAIGNTLIQYADENTILKWNEIQAALKKLNTLTCDVCQFSQLINNMSMDDRDFLQIKKGWGYFSTHDCEIHQLNICCECYDKHILEPMKKYIKIKEY